VSALLLSPHNDDETLFASGFCIAHNPHVVVVLRSQVQEDRYGITADTREQETGCALDTLGVTGWTQWPYLDSDPDWGAVENALRSIDDRLQPDRVFAPAVELGGHAHHNLVGDLAHVVFGDRVTSYLTYVRGNGRSRSDREVPFMPAWPAVKLRALACYLSQIAEPSTRDWFLDGGLREWYA